MSTLKVTLLNIDGSKMFTQSQKLVEEQFAEHNQGLPKRNQHQLQSLSSRNPFRLADSLAEPTDLIHLMAHGEPEGNLLQIRLKGLWKRRFSTETLRYYWEEFGQTPKVQCVLVDACDTFRPTWLKEIPKMIPSGESVIYIGTTRPVLFHECESYTTAFYAQLLRGPDGPDLVSDDFKGAHRAAGAAYRRQHRQECPFKLRSIQGCRESN
jgi:hypothetical protein